jgi:hypothetical protein
MWGKEPGYLKLFADYLYMRWAAVAVDIAYIVVEPWKLLILTDTSWECGEGKYEAQVEIEMALQTSERIEALLKEQGEP